MTYNDANGNPLVGGKIYTYVAGTTTPLASYTDATGTTPATNPIILDAAGRSPYGAIWASGTYKFVLKDSADVTIQTDDNVSATFGSGDMTKAVYDPANVNQQLVGTTAVQSLSGKTFDSGTSSTTCTFKSASTSYTGVQFQNTASGGKNYLLAVSPTGGLGAAGSLMFYDETASATRLAITSSGQACVTGGSTALAPASTTGAGAMLDPVNGIYGSASAFSALNLQRTTSDGQITAFWRQTTQVGNISVTASATAYNTSSDMRLKKNPQPIDSGSILDGIKAYKFQWNTDNSDGYGVYAQEVNEVFPQAVTKGAEYEDFWSVDYSKFVPLLIAEVQSLRARVAALEAK